MKLYETITAENWVQRRVETKHRACILGHLWRDVGPNYNDQRRRLYEAALTLYPERLFEHHVDFSQEVLAIGDFNDHPDTTLDDVLRVCKLADV